MKLQLFLGVAALIALQSLTSCSSVPESVIARVGSDTISVGEYERMYLRTRFAPPQNMNDREDFLFSLINYKLKLQEAEARDLHRDQTFQSELEQYRDQLGLTVLFQEELVEPGIRALYDRRLEEVLLQHVVIRYKKNDAGENDTLTTRRMAEEVLALAHEGVSFDTLIARYSDDGSKERTNGVLGWFIAGTSFPKLDDMMYEIEPGEIAPQLLRTVFGYHVFRLLDRKPARQRLRAAQILHRLDLDNPNDTTEAYAALAPVLDSLQRGLATFEELARRHSQDTLSGPEGGDLGWMERGSNIEPSFEEVLFSLAVGETSPIFRTAFGMHIIKVLDEEPPRPFEEQRDHLRTVYTNERYEMDQRNYLARLREKYQFSPNTTVINRLVSRIDSTVNTSTPGWERNLRKEDMDAYLFRLSYGPVTVREVISFLKKEPSLQMRRITNGLLDTLCTELAGRLAALKEAERIEESNEQFRHLFTEYRESTLITMLEDREIWDRNETDESKLRAWFEDRRNDFRLPPRVQFAEIYTYVKPYADRYLDSLLAGTDFLDLASRRTQRPGYFDRRGVWDYVEIGANELSQATQQMVIGDVAGPIPFQSGFSLIKLLDREDARLKTWEEARPEVLSAYKERRAGELREELHQRLREKYGVEIWKQHLEKTFPVKES
ncbi:MAG: peptidylprolyl isomerase [Bacteroidetes bacterium]|nr:peptidylprolyl isomerase [Bacteroidota bacterium]